MQENKNSIWNNKIFKRLGWITAISSLGDGLYSLAITLSVYNITGSVVGVAGMWLIRALVRIPCQFFSGVIVDRFNKKRISVIVYILSAFLMFAIAFTNDRFLLLAYIIIFILQGTSDMDNMAQMGIMSETISKDHLMDANNVFSIIGTVTLFVSPAIGGLLYKLYGTTVLYIIDAFSFVAAAIIMSLIPYQHRACVHKQEKFTLLTHAKKGIKEVKDLPLIQYIMLISVFFGMLGRFYEIDKVYVADSIMNIGPEGIVYFSYAMSIGGLLAPLVTKGIKKWKKDELLKFSVVSILYAFSFVAWGAAKTIWISLAAIFVLGMLETSQGIMTNVIFMSQINNEVMGMVMAFRKIVIVLSAIIGIILAPVLIKICGVRLSFLIVGGVTIALSFGAIFKTSSRGFL